MSPRKPPAKKPKKKAPAKKGAKKPRRRASTSQPRVKSGEPHPSGGVLVPQPHGGALMRGGTHPNAGRPPSEIRERLRGSLAERLEVAEEIASGTPKQIKVRCTNRSCRRTMVVSIPVKPAERIAALDFMAKYGVGAAKDDSTMTRDEVVGLVQQIAAVVYFHVKDAGVIEKIDTDWARLLATETPDAGGS